MVLHNNKWDRKATRKFNKKHGIPTTFKPKIPHAVNVLEEEETSEASDSDPSTGSSDSEGQTAGDANENTESGTESQAEVSGSVARTSTGGTGAVAEVRTSRRKKHLSSNAWRYETQEADDEYGISNIDREDEDLYLQQISQTAGDALSKYLDAENKRAKDVEERNDAVADIFESQLSLDENIIESSKKKKSWTDTVAGRTSKEGKKIVTYDANDPSFAESDRKIEKLKYAESIRERYKNSSRRERDAELERLKKLPKQIAFAAKQEKEMAEGQQLEDDFVDNFWSEMDQKDLRSKSSVSADGGNASKPTMSRGWGISNEKSDRTVSPSHSQVHNTATSTTSVANDDDFLDNLLSFK
ncbi:uncharacterized protein V2V93DRAFT_371667 [Kockiozyma suomiensis]|uniref:uncharacterized protein n=1 Tax=Kockiozyma suomiensis TaxID=1337062 RepID=UPI003343740D